MEPTPLTATLLLLFSAYESGVVVAHDGGFLPGIQMPPEPVAGTYHALERAPGVAEDYANIIAVDESITVPQGTYTDTVRTSERTPFEPGHLSGKSYAAADRDCAAVMRSSSYHLQTARMVP